jgi:hypothetical protein
MVTTMYVDAFGERRLWLSVIVQTIRDALATHTRSPQDAQAKEDARRWLAGNTEDYLAVCEMAGIEPGKLRNWWADLTQFGDPASSLSAILAAAAAMTPEPAHAA